ncbi:hypothetical protein MLD38_034161 [Melastoma candidum]|uniref:Uncharacterized protein n=1 Tax=Melastoma candidum TaxID=119954 RepID=A0ACB9M9K6_9MYRT|nr:hypothetical protein MLD38_034161 [Melastoma candidum]
MSSSSSYIGFLGIPFLLLWASSLLSYSLVVAQVPPSHQFKEVNDGELGFYIAEYGADWRPLSISRSPFQLFFYNTTPDAFTLAIRMGTRRSTSSRRFVWEANRGNPVGNNATLTFGANGNLVLADHDGRVAWQTGTANKGVVGLEMSPNGNMVLYNSKGRYLWQSFDSPTDTLLVGQSLRVGGVNRLVSRASPRDNVNGPYSLVMEPRGLSFYYAGRNAPVPVSYYTITIQHIKSNVERMTFHCTPNYDNHTYDLDLRYQAGKGASAVEETIMRTRTLYNSTLSYLRLGIDGNLRFITFDNIVDYRAWDETYTFFTSDQSPLRDSVCQIPTKCGSFGLCEDSQCVACPLATRLAGWSKDCVPPKLTSCNPRYFGYYKLVGVDHFSSKYTSGISAKVGDCEVRCTKECKCAGYFYNEASSRCWIAYDLMTLTKVGNTSHVGYIKTPKI